MVWLALVGAAAAQPTPDDADAVEAVEVEGAEEPAPPRDAPADGDAPADEPEAVGDVDPGTPEEAARETPDEGDAAPAPADEDEAAGVEAEAGATPEWLSGSLITRFRSRHDSRGQDDDADQDLFSTLLLTARASDWAEVVFKGDLFVDAGRHGSNGRSFDDLWDTWDSSAQGRVQEAYVRLMDLGPVELRLGRQLHVQGRTVQFDGVWARAELGSLVSVRGFGGVPVHFYESSRRGDAVGGGGIDVDPTSTTRVSLDYLHVTDFSTTTGGKGARHDDLYGLSLRQSFGRWGRIHARGEVLDDEVRSVDGGWTLTAPDLAMSLRGRIYALFDAQVERTIDLDPFAQVMGPEQPHTRYEVALWKGLFDLLGVELSYLYRDVRRGQDEGVWNKDAHRWAATLFLYDPGVKGLTLSVTYEQWSVEGEGGTDRRNLGGELSLRIGEHVRVAAGSTYMLYAYRQYADGERFREDVRIHHARVEFRTDRQRLQVEYAFEDDDVDGFHTVRLGYRHDF